MADFNSWRIEHSSRAVVAKKAGAEPPGYQVQVTEDMLATTNKRKALDAAALEKKQNALMQEAMAPAKQAGLMCFMLWMSGNSLQVFSIMMLVSCIYAPVQAIANVAKAIPANPDVQVLLPRVVFCGVHLGQLAFAAYKLNSLGLLPTYASDWMSQMDSPVAVECSVGPLSFS